ncbi:MAG TPA: histidine kinase dimerization/phosphoacceptor domain -containing protein [Allosphingosinicella sp.]
MALIVSSQAPLLLIDEDLIVIEASNSFCRDFQLDPAGMKGVKLAALGAGEWDVPQLESLLKATVAGAAAIDAYEMDLIRDGKKPCRLVLNAHKLDYFDADKIRIVLAVTDVTSARLAEKVKDELVREKQVLLQELQHRVANSLQIIASVLMQSARKVQSDETRAHLHDAHHRVMSIATMQKQLAVSRLGEVALRTYFGDLCRSIGASMISDHNQLSLTTTVDDSKVSADVSVSLGLIVTELVINSLKHAFPDQSRPGKITLDYFAEGTGWTLTVGDNGIGMPDGNSSSKPGLGTGIVEALSKQLDATVSISDARPGTTVSVVHC